MKVDARLLLNRIENVMEDVQDVRAEAISFIHAVNAKLDRKTKEKIMRYLNRTNHPKRALLEGIDGVEEWNVFWLFDGEDILIVSNDALDTEGYQVVFEPEDLNTETLLKLAWELADAVRRVLVGQVSKGC